MKPEQFYKDLKNSLEATANFPAKYLYKFIVPTDGNGVQEIETIFNHQGAVITTRKSSKGTFTSISIALTMPSSDKVIENYKKASKIKGIISL